MSDKNGKCIQPKNKDLSLTATDLICENIERNLKILKRDRKIILLLAIVMACMVIPISIGYLIVS